MSYPTLDHTPVIDWSPGFEGTPSVPNEYSGDAALIVHGPLSMDGSDTIASITITLAKRENPIYGAGANGWTFGIELTLDDVQRLSLRLTEIGAAEQVRIMRRKEVE